MTNQSNQNTTPEPTTTEQAVKDLKVHEVPVKKALKDSKALINELLLRYNNRNTVGKAKEDSKLALEKAIENMILLVAGAIQAGIIKDDATGFLTATVHKTKFVTHGKQVDFLIKKALEKLQGEKPQGTDAVSIAMVIRTPYKDSPEGATEAFIKSLEGKGEEPETVTPEEVEPEYHEINGQTIVKDGEGVEIEGEAKEVDSDSSTKEDDSLWLRTVKTVSVALGVPARLFLWGVSKLLSLTYHALAAISLAFGVLAVVTESATKMLDNKREKLKSWIDEAKKKAFFGDKKGSESSQNAS